MAESAGKTHPMRPYWHVDAKWISGLLLFALWSASLALLAVYLITRPAPAIDLAGRLLAAMTTGRSEASADVAAPVDPAGTMNADLAAFTAQVEAAGDAGLRPFPGVDAVITLEDLQGRTPQQVSLFLFKQVAEQVYWDGAGAVAQDQSDESALSTLGLMALFTNDTHLRIKSLLIPLLGVDLLLLALLIYFSSGAGRLISPAIVVTLASAPGLLAAVFTLSRVGHAGAGSEETPAMLAGLQDAFGPTAVSAIEIGVRGYLYSLSTGLLLLLLGFALAVFRFGRRRALTRS